MSENLANAFYRSFFLSTLVLGISVLGTLLPSKAAASGIPTSCEKAHRLATGETLALPADDTIQWLAVEAFERGLLHVELEAPAGLEAQPAVGFWGFECVERSEASIASRSTEHMTLEVEAFETAYFRIALPAGVPSFGVEARAALLPLGPPTKGGEDEEIIELDGLRAPPQELCPRTDDHGDSLACASPGTHRKLAGRLDEPGDEDTFRVVLGSADEADAFWRVVARTTGDLRLTLYDADGLRLAGGLEDGLALRAGAYYLRVGSREATADDGVPSDYVLALDVERW